MIHKFRFDELNDKAQENAVKDYQSSFLEEDEDNTPQCFSDVYEALQNDCIDDFWYNENGDLVNEKE